MEVQRTHRPTVRGLASRLKAADKTVTDTVIDSKECQVYSRRVEEVFKSLPQVLFASSATSSLYPSGLYLSVYLILQIFHCVYCVFYIIKH